MDKRITIADGTMQAITTEHFSLQGARSSTITEVNGRQQAYLGLLSAMILALALIAQATNVSSTFYTFAFVLLPLVYFVGLATLERLNQIWGEWLLYQIGMNRIRRFYTEVDPDLERYFVLPTHDDAASGLWPAGIPAAWRWRWMFGTSGMIGVVNSFVAGVLAALVARESGAVAAPLPWLAGAIAFTASVVVARSMSSRALRRHDAQISALFPAPANRPR